MENPDSGGHEEIDTPEIPTTTTARELAALKDAYERPDERAIFVAERSLAARVSPADHVLLMQTGIEGGQTYAPVVSKLLHAVAHGPDFGHETLQESFKRITLYQRFLVSDFNQRGMPKSTGAILYYNPRLRYLSTPAQRQSATAFIILRALKGRTNVTQTLNQLIPVLASIIASIFFHTYYSRDNNNLSDSAIEELSTNLYITVNCAACIYKETRPPMPSSIPPNTANFLYRLEAAVMNLIKAHVGPAVTYEIRTECRDSAARLTELTSTGTAQATVDWFKETADLFMTSGQKFTEERIEALEQRRTVSASRDASDMPLTQIPMFRYHHWQTFMHVVRNGLLEQHIARHGETDFKTTRRMFYAADHPSELVEYANDLLKTPSDRRTQDLLNTIFNIIAEKPTFLQTLIILLQPFRKMEQASHNQTDFSFFRELFSQTRLQTQPEYTDNLFNLLEKPDFQSFYKTCAVCADLVELENAEGPFTDRFCKRISSAPNYYTDPLRRAVVRNVAERLPEPTKTTFIQKFANGSWETQELDGQTVSIQRLAFGDILDALQDQSAAITQQPAATGGQQKLNLQEKRVARKAGKKAEREQRRNAPIELLRSLGRTLVAAEAFPRDINALIAGIRGRRSIQISDSGYEVSMKHIDSPSLTAVFSKAVIKRSAQTGIPPTGIACHINFMGAAAARLHCSLTPDGELAVRILEDGTDTGQVTRGDIGRLGIAENVFEEVRYAALKALDVVYVRRESETSGGARTSTPPNTPSLHAAQPPTGTDTPTAPDQSKAAIVEGSPKADERFERAMTFDPDAEETAASAETRRRDLIRIGSMRSRTIEIFRAIGETPTPPADIGSLLLFTRKVAGSEVFFEPVANPAALYIAVRQSAITLEDLFIRATSAHAEELPYCYTRRYSHTSIGVGEYPFQMRPYYTVKQKGMSRHARTRYQTFTGDIEHGESLNLTPGERMSYHDMRTSDPFLVRLHQRLRTEEVFYGHIATAWKEMEQEIEERSKEQESIARRNPQPDKPLAHIEAVRRIVIEAHRRFSARADTLAELREVTTSTPDPAPDDPVRMLLRFPQGRMPYNKTFNHGRFQSVQFLLDSVKFGEDEIAA